MALKHYLADYILQVNWIARGKELREGWFAPFAVHVLIHAALTLSIALVIAPRLWWLAGADLVAHAAIDRCKTLVARWGVWTTHQIQFWWLSGLDQLLHQVTNVALAAAFLAL
jgi:hypothetical protein